MGFAQIKNPTFSFTSLEHIPSKKRYPLCKGIIEKVTPNPTPLIQACFRSDMIAVISSVSLNSPPLMVFGDFQPETLIISMLKQIRGWYQLADANHETAWVEVSIADMGTTQS